MVCAFGARWIFVSFRETCRLSFRQGNGLWKIGVEILRSIKVPDCL